MADPTTAPRCEKRYANNKREVHRCRREAGHGGRHVCAVAEWISDPPQEIDDDAARASRESRLVLAASRGVYAALNEPGAPGLADAARRFNYRARTAEGDAFETAFLWAREEADRHGR